MLNIEIGFGFGVELFMLVFSLLCWLFFDNSSVNHSTSEKPESSSAVQEISLYQVNNDGILEVHKDSLLFYIHGLKIAKLRKAASLLKEAKIIQEHEKTGGKGITKSILADLIERKILTDREAVIKVLKDFDIEIAALT